MLSGATAAAGMLPASIQKALAINPPPGSTWHDAEHVVLLMQENRSFDHCFGTLRGVRGFNDPRAITQPNQLPVWLQTNKEGETYAPFRLNLKDSKATWMNSLPHSWENQTDARNNGKMNRWLDVKRSGHKEYAHMPLTLGYYSREDIPFYYSLADAFTVCDQHFCSSLTGTTPNRLYFWTGTIREKQEAAARAHVRNEEVDYGIPVSWKTFPERLEENGISWKIYQNEISIDTGLKGEEDAWLSSFTDNPLEWFTQYNITLATRYRQQLQIAQTSLQQEIADLEAKGIAATDTTAAKTLTAKKLQLQQTEQQLKVVHAPLATPLSQQALNLHQKAFTNNQGDPHYRELTSLQYQDGDTTRTMQVPKGDVLHQFRQDVQNGELPTVSWLVAPENFSDHPGAPWYGAWYVSEVLDILTQNPEVWKKTIFILTYDENDGCFDHVPPFAAPHPDDKASGFASAGIDTGSEFVTLQQELQYHPEQHCRESNIGLGYRVPMIVASPWSRGGWVNSQVFDHTSCLQFLEAFAARKGKPVKETNISEWRRTICGNLTSIFRPYNGEKITLPGFLAKHTVLENIHKAQFKQVPTGYTALTKADIQAITQQPNKHPLLPKQEPGTRPSCALPYNLQVNGVWDANAQTMRLQMSTGTGAGAPFTVYAPGSHLKANSTTAYENARSWNFTVKTGDTLTHDWPLSGFENNQYQLQAYGPNGFYRLFKGHAQHPLLEVQCSYQPATDSIAIHLTNKDSKTHVIQLHHHAYGLPAASQTLAAAGSKNSTATLLVNLRSSHHWYDFSVTAAGNQYWEQRFAGRMETGRPGISDPAMA